MFRRADARDGDELARIYNQSITPNRNVTAHTEQVTAENRIAWLASFRPPFGVWVYETSDRSLAGWCGLGPFAVRPRWPRIAEVSVYVDERAQASLMGPRLLACLVDEARRLGFRSLVSIVSDQNRISIRGCLIYGFREVATLREMGRVGGMLGSAVWLQKDLLQDDPKRYRRLRDSIVARLRA